MVAVAVEVAARFLVIGVVTVALVEGAAAQLETTQAAQEGSAAAAEQVLMLEAVVAGYTEG
jgi:hypothetical protein